MERAIDVDVIALGSNSFAHPIDVGEDSRKSTSDPNYGVSLFMLKQTCLAIGAP
jgi:hypothetical protein